MARGGGALPQAGTVVALHGAVDEVGEVDEVVAVGAPLLTVAARASEERGGTRNHDTDHRAERTGGLRTRGGNGAAGKDTGSGAVLVGDGTGQGTSATRRRVHGAGGPTASTATGGPPAIPPPPAAR
jgi:2-oxoisovalerate dehydrogenase E2 component (dihydrolipoyl transacylase)